VQSKLCYSLASQLAAPQTLMLVPLLLPLLQRSAHSLPANADAATLSIHDIHLTSIFSISSIKTVHSSSS
jgi:hypothetical protein